MSGPRSLYILRELPGPQATIPEVGQTTRTGKPFWEDESFDHWVRSEAELQELTGYVEGNPVKAKLVRADDKKRSSAPQ